MIDDVPRVLPESDRVFEVLMLDERCVCWKLSMRYGKCGDIDVEP